MQMLTDTLKWTCKDGTKYTLKETYVLVNETLHEILKKSLKTHSPLRGRRAARARGNLRDLLIQLHSVIRLRDELRDHP